MRHKGPGVACGQGCRSAAAPAAAAQPGPGVLGVSGQATRAQLSKPHQPDLAVAGGGCRHSLVHPGLAARAKGDLHTGGQGGRWSCVLRRLRRLWRSLAQLTCCGQVHQGFGGVSVQWHWLTLWQLQRPQLRGQTSTSARKAPPTCMHAKPAAAPDLAETLRQCCCGLHEALRALAPAGLQQRRCWCKRVSRQAHPRSMPARRSPRPGTGTCWAECRCRCSWPAAVPPRPSRSNRTRWRTSPA